MVENNALQKKDRIRQIPQGRVHTGIEGLDDLIEGYIQTVLAITAIDRMAASLINQKGKFRKKLFRSLNDDAALLEEILI